MNTSKIIDVLGGRKVVIEMTGLSRGRISQWATDKDIPVPWLKFFEAKFPELDWETLRRDDVNSEASNATDGGDQPHNPTEDSIAQDASIFQKDFHV